jgi:hypothetical protein
MCLAHLFSLPVHLSEIDDCVLFGTNLLYLFVDDGNSFFIFAGDYLLKTPLSIIILDQ